MEPIRLRDRRVPGIARRRAPGEPARARPNFPPRPRPVHGGLGRLHRRAELRVLVASRLGQADGAAPVTPTPPVTARLLPIERRRRADLDRRGGARSPLVAVEPRLVSVVDAPDPPPRAGRRLSRPIGRPGPRRPAPGRPCGGPGDGGVGLAVHAVARVDRWGRTSPTLDLCVASSPARHRPRSPNPVLDPSLPPASAPSHRPRRSWRPSLAPCAARGLTPLTAAIVGRADAPQPASPR